MDMYLFKIHFYWRIVLYHVVLVYTAQWSEPTIHRHTSFVFRSPPHRGHHRVLSRVSWAVQQVLMIYLFYIVSIMYICQPWPPDSSTPYFTIINKIYCDTKDFWSYDLILESWRPMIPRFKQFQPSCSILILDVRALSLDPWWGKCSGSKCCHILVIMI